MSTREWALSLIDRIPEERLVYVIPYLEEAADEVPNDETVAAMEEIERGGGTLYSGSTEEIFSELLGE